MRRTRPEVTLRAAMSLDGSSLDGSSLDGSSLGGKRRTEDERSTASVAMRASADGDRALREQLQRAADAVLVSGEHMLAAAPAGGSPFIELGETLRAQRRADGRSELPMPVVVAVNAAPLLVCPAFQRLLHADRTNKAGYADRDLPRVYTTEQTPPSVIDRLRLLGVQVRVMGTDEVDLPAMLEDLYTAGVEWLVVDGDTRLNATLLAQQQVDEVAFYVAPVLLGRSRMPALLGDAEAAVALPLALRITTIRDDGEGFVIYCVVASTPAAPSRAGNASGDDAGDDADPASTTRW